MHKAHLSAQDDLKDREILNVKLIENMEMKLRYDYLSSDGKTD